MPDATTYDLLIQGGTLLTGEPGSPFIEDAAVAVSAGRFVFIGDRRALPKESTRRGSDTNTDELPARGGAFSDVKWGMTKLFLKYLHPPAERIELSAKRPRFTNTPGVALESSYHDEAQDLAANTYTSSAS